SELQGVARQVKVLQSDLLNGVGESLDLVVANPPYVPDRERSTLQAEIRDHEPASALFAGPDGLQVIERRIGSVGEKLHRAGYTVFEFGFGQADAIERLVRERSHLTLRTLRQDLQGIPRVAIVERQ